MTNWERKYLSDIIQAIELIDEFIADTVNFKDYQGDNKTKSAVERQLAIIGEAVNKHKQQGKPDLENSIKIINFRNRLVHAYDAVDDTIVWVIIKRHLPLLKKEVQKLMD